MQLGTLIVLNGASSAGKTTIAQALLPRLGANTILTGLDDILDRVQPFGPEDGNPLIRSFKILAFNIRDGRLSLFRQLHREAVAHVQAGHAVIVETTLMDARHLHDAASCFAPIGGWFIGVKPPLEVSERWEAQRGDRPRGHARRHYDLVHTHDTYDLLIDPSQMSAAACSDTIIRHITTTSPDAFAKLLRG